MFKFQVQALPWKNISTKTYQPNFKKYIKIAIEKKRDVYTKHYRPNYVSDRSKHGLGSGTQRNGEEDTKQKP